MADAEDADGVPGHFPQFLARAPNAAGLLYGAVQVGFVSGDSHADEVMVVSPRLSCAPAPWHLLDEKLNRFQAPAARLVIKVTHAYQPLAIAGNEFLGARHAGAQSQVGFHRVSPCLKAQYLAQVYGGRPAFFGIRRSTRPALLKRA